MLLEENYIYMFIYTPTKQSLIWTLNMTLAVNYGWDLNSLALSIYVYKYLLTNFLTSLIN